MRTRKTQQTTTQSEQEAERDCRERARENWEHWEQMPARKQQSTSRPQQRKM